MLKLKRMFVLVLAIAMLTSFTGGVAYADARESMEKQLQELQERETKRLHREVVQMLISWKPNAKDYGNVLKSADYYMSTPVFFKGLYKFNLSLEEPFKFGALLRFYEVTKSTLDKRTEAMFKIVGLPVDSSFEHDLSNVIAKMDDIIAIAQESHQVLSMYFEEDITQPVADLYHSYTVSLDEFDSALEQFRSRYK